MLIFDLLFKVPIKTMQSPTENPPVKIGWVYSINCASKEVMALWNEVLEYMPNKLSGEVLKVVLRGTIISTHVHRILGSKESYCTRFVHD
jgi:hypothetical protein